MSESQQAQTRYSMRMCGEYHTFHPANDNLLLCVDCTQVKANPYHTKPELPETIAEEASRIVYGDREQTYDDPNRNFRKLAYMVQGVLDDKLKDGVLITPNDIALIMVCLKISRESFKPTRENRVDGIGYFLCLDRIVQSMEQLKDAK